MPEYKRQHFLPCAYLKNFSPDGAAATRTSRVWRTDATRKAFVPAESQCAGDYLFSKESPKKSESEFQKLEDGYSAAVAKIWSGGDPTTYEYFSLIVSAFDLYARNIVHENNTDGDGRHAYELRITTLMNELIVGNHTGTALPEAELLARMKEFWKVRLFRTAPGRTIATSDHPVLCFSWGPGEGIDFLLMPVTPTFCAAVFDRRTTQTTGGSLTDSDGRNLFDALASHAHSCLYSDTEPEEGLVAAFRDRWSERTNPTTSTDSEKWTLDLIVPRDPNVFSFIRPLTAPGPKLSQ